MRRFSPRFASLLMFGWVVTGADAGDLTVTLTGPGVDVVTLVGAVDRWDADGQARVPIDPKAKIESPRVDVRATPAGPGRWTFASLPPGRYDLVIVAPKIRLRVEGFHYPPLREFDPVLAPTAPEPLAEVRDRVLADMAKSRHYENKVSTLYVAEANEKQVRLLVQLVRDLPTSYDGEAGFPVATIRHEAWQYTFHYGGWAKDRRTEVLDRVLIPRDQLARWAWVWDTKLGGIEIAEDARSISIALPSVLDPAKVKGWLPGN
jgi:hypothetical protein